MTVTSAPAPADATENDGEQWDLIIGPHRTWWDLRLHELWESRELVLMFVQRDLVAAYKQTILGPLWHVVQPLLTTLTFTVIFARLAGLPTDDAPAFLFYFAGTILWTYFATCLTGAANTFTPNAGLFGKVYFPRLVVPISILLSRLVTFGIQFVVFLVFLTYYALTTSQVGVNAGVLMFPALIVLLAGLGLGWGILFSALTARYRDFQQLIAFGVQLLMYATPVIYPLSFVKAAYRPYVEANPMTPIIEAFRWAFLGTGTWSAWGLLYSACVMLATLLVGILVFNRVEATVIDTV